MTGPTEAQLRVLRAFAKLKARRGYPPTNREIKSALGFSSNTAVTCHYEALCQKGLINYAPKRGGAHRVARGVTLTEAGRALVAGDKSPTGTLKLESRCTVCNAATFAPERGCFVCRLGAAA